jgi:hypothetical protein
MSSPQDEVLRQETRLARMMTEGPGRKVLVVAVAVDNGATATMANAASDGCTLADVKGFIWGLRTEADRLEAQYGQ